MSSVKGLFVAFDADLDEMVAEQIIEAIKLIKHVGAVEPAAANFEDWHAQMRVRIELAQKFRDLHGDILGIKRPKGQT